MGGMGTGETRDQALACAFLQESLAAIQQEQARIRHCFKQLSDEQVWQGPTPHVNSIGTIVRHLLGNIRQWMLHGVGGAEDVRDRPGEFIAGNEVPKDALLATLDGLLDDVYRTLNTLGPDALLEDRRIQGWDTNVLSAIYSTVTHLEGHAQQIVYVTHMFLKEAYVPFWKPENTEQGG